MDPINTNIRYQPDEKPPKLLAFALGLQLVAITVGGVVLTPAIVVRAANGTEAFLSWAVFAAIMVSGVTTILQAIRVGRVGSGYVLLMGTSGAFISVCITAIAQGGPGMLATLVIISSFFQFALSTRLSLFRRIFTPTVAGTILMLIPVTVMPFIFDMLKDVPESAPKIAAPLSALVTLFVISGMALKATGAMRLWAPVFGIVLGSVVAGLFGLYNTELVAQASWVGFPTGEWPGFNLDFGPVFWTLLPAFIFVTLIGAIETIGDAAAVQNVSWRRPRSVDFRAVQGAVAADGMGNFLSGLLGTVPNTTYSTSISATELTGVAARSVGVAVGVVFIILAFLPKALAIILAIPSAVAAAYITVLLSMLFVLGMKMVVQDGVDYRKGLIVGVAFWVGVGFQNGVIFPEHVSKFAGGLLQNGMTAGGLVAIFLTLFVEITQPRSCRIEVEFSLSVLPKIRDFLRDFASRNGWDTAMCTRLESASEEALLTILERKIAGENKDRRLQLVAHRENGGATLEFIVAPGNENLRDRMMLLSEQTAATVSTEREVSLRLLRHFASSVHHQQYHDTDIVTICVEAPRDENS